MKKLSGLLLAITIAASSFAHTANGTTVKTIITDQIVTSLKIYDNVQVVLTNDESNEIRIIGEKTNVENIAVKISNGELTITGCSNEGASEKVIVYIPAASVSGVHIHGSSSISSSGTLTNEMLEVTINGEGTSNIQTTGKISLNTIRDFPLESSSL